ncbi:hypothetical protein DL98DRAFT_149663 [Cadophora sp. DSE1049]|nr:hypothetical protein DL98DRAFT_149663 [Cadophora sp. DSE1049]
MENHEPLEQIDIQDRYLRPKPNFDELRQTTVDASFEIASFPEVHKIVSSIRNNYLRSAYGRLWSILVYLAYNNFKSVTLASGRSTARQKADAQGGLTRKEEGYIKGLLVGVTVSRRNFKEIINRGHLWKDPVLRSDCGILLLAKQQISLNVELFEALIQQYLSYVGGTEDCRNLVCDIFSAFSPTNRVSVSYYTRAYEKLRDIITTCSAKSIRNQSPMTEVAFRNRIGRGTTSNEVYQAKDPEKLEAGRMIPLSTRSPRTPQHPRRGYFPLPQSQPAIALVLQDLWRTPVEQRLFEFYWESICTRRTVFTYPNSNSYTRVVSSQRCEGVMAMLFCLACAYMRVYVPSESEMFAALELRYYGKVIRFLKENVGNPGFVESILKVVWLLVHHQVVSEDQNANRRWSMHCKVLGILQSKGVCINYEWALFPTYESVVKFTGLKNEKANDGIDVREFMKCNHPSHGCDRECPQKLSMISDWGGSRELLVLMGSINAVEVKTRGLPDQRINAGRSLEARIRAIKQWTKEPVERNREVALEIARSYELTARVKVMVRLFG